MTDEEKLAERYVNGIPIFAEEGEGFSRTQMQRAFLAGLKAGKDEAKELLRFWVNDFYDNSFNSGRYKKRHKALVESEQFLKEK